MIRAKGFLYFMLVPMAFALPAAPAAARDLASALADIDQGFICPEFLPDDGARQAEPMAFSRALASVGPTRITYRQAAYIRTKLLARHNCGGGVSAIAATTPVAMAAPGAAE